MTDEISNQLAGYVATEILKQPARVINPDEALLTSGLIELFSPG